MKNLGFDNAKYVKLQSSKIAERVADFNKLYLEFGGKLFDDFHASRVLPGFEPDAKIRMLLKLKDRVEMMVVISADHIEKNKIRSDLGITYSQDLKRLIDAFELVGLKIGGIVITHYKKQLEATKLRKQLENSGYKVAYHYTIDNYPNDIETILSAKGFGRNEYISTNADIVVVTAPGPGSGKMATCLSQMYHDNNNGIKAGYAKFETFPVWNLPLNHPVNLAYEAATVDLDDINMIDPFHLENYQKIAINYNRDVEVFPVLNQLMTRINGKEYYKSPTDMGVNMVGFCLKDNDICCQASRDEIVRRYFAAIVNQTKDKADENEIYKLETIMRKAEVSIDSRKVYTSAENLAKKTGEPAVAIELNDGRIITGKTSKLMGASSAALLNACKAIAKLPDVKLLSEEIIQPVQTLKTHYLKGNNPRLHTDEVLVALAIGSNEDEMCKQALIALDELANCEIHSSVILSEVDINTIKKLGMHLTMSPNYQSKKLYHKSS